MASDTTLAGPDAPAVALRCFFVFPKDDPDPCDDHETRPALKRKQLAKPRPPSMRTKVANARDEYEKRLGLMKRPIKSSSLVCFGQQMCDDTKLAVNNLNYSLEFAVSIKDRFI